jgi:hypothetical protein
VAGLSFVAQAAEAPCPAARLGSYVEIIAFFRLGLFCQNRPRWRGGLLQSSPSRPALKSLRLSDRVCSAKIALAGSALSFNPAHRGVR